MSEEVIDLPEFLERVQDDKELLLELLDIFSADFKEKRVGLEAAIKSKNSEEVRNIAHSLKGATGNISAKPMRESFSLIEEKARGNDLSGMEEQLPTLDEQFVSLETRIEQLKQELGN